MITDSQVHIWTVSPGESPPSDPQDHQLKHPKGFLAEELIAEMDAIGVDRAVICPPRAWMETATEYALDAAARYPGRLAIMDSFDWTGADARSNFERVRDNQYILGMRTSVRALANSLDHQTVRWILGECEREAIPITVLASGMPAVIVPVMKRYPRLRMTFDHMARVPDAKGSAAFASLNDLLAFTKYENVGVKVSSVPDSSAERYPFPDLYEGVRRIHEAFGARRMLWGSDLSGLSVSYLECLNHFREGLDFLTEDDKERILGKALAAIYDWPEGPSNPGRQLEAEGGC